MFVHQFHNLFAPKNSFCTVLGSYQILVPTRLRLWAGEAAAKMLHLAKPQIAPSNQGEESCSCKWVFPQLVVSKMVGLPWKIPSTWMIVPGVPPWRNGKHQMFKTHGLCPCLVPSICLKKRFVPIQMCHITLHSPWTSDRDSSLW